MDGSLETVVRSEVIPVPTTSPSAATLALLFEPISEELAAVEIEFVKQVQSHVALIPTIGTYIQAGGGKRVRPAVLLMAARMAGYRGADAVLYASVVEFIHTATLVHDDMIDEADTRRGRPAVHAKWGNDVTVLLGDFLYIKSMSMALTPDRLDLVRLLCEVTLRMIEGELYQLTRNGVAGISEEEHFDIVRRKTAYLFAGSARIGGMLGPITTAQQEALWDYGLNIGMAFQVVDDLLDYTGAKDVVGKPVAGDLREGKVTLPLIHLQSENAEARDLVAAVISSRDVTAAQWQRLLALMAEHQSVDYARARAREFADRAKAALDAFPAGPERDALLTLPDFVLGRDH
jgi:octaprenyl-diphosphate synthase